MDIDYRHADWKTFYYTGAGTNTPIIITTPKNTYRELKMAKLTLSTDATVATREISLLVYDPDGNPCGAVLYASRTATQSGEYYVMPCESLGFNCTEITDELVIPPDYSLRLLIVAGVAGDTATMRLTFADISLDTKDDKSAGRRRT